MKLAELIDLENQLLIDNDLEPMALRKRDREIGKLLEKKQFERRRLFLAWLQRLQKQDEPSMGKHVASIYDWLKISLIFAGLLIGASTASATLAYDGSNPVNIVHFLAVFVGLQTLMLLVFLLSLLPGVFTKLMPGKGELLKAIRLAGFLLARGLERLLSRLPREKIHRWQHDFKMLRLRRTRYPKVERWLLASLTQRFGVAFNLAALAVCLYLIVFSDLAFAWNTTLQIESARFHKIVSLIAAPWSSFFPEAVPSPELVEMSRFFRIEGQYQLAGETARTANPEAVGGWWAFLALSLVSYGLLPRLATLLFTKLKYRTILKNLPLDVAEFDALYDRLTTPIIETRAPFPDEKSAQGPDHEFVPAQVSIPEKTCSVVLWGEIDLNEKKAAEAAMQRFGWRCERILPAGGFDAKIDDATCNKLTATKNDDSPVLVLVESWEAPNKSVLHFVKNLRQNSDPKRPILIGLMNARSNGSLLPPEKNDWQNWRDMLITLGDPYLRVEPMLATSV